MAARQFVVVALIFFAIVGMASAESGPAPDASPAVGAGVGPAPDNNIIGTTDGSSHGAAPAGGPGTDGTSSGLTPSDSPKSGATTLEASTFAGVVVSAVVASFFY